MPGIRRIAVPQPITLLNPETGEVLPAPDDLPQPIPFALFIRRALRHPAWAKTLDRVRSNMAIASALGVAPAAFEQPALVISDEDWRTLCDAIKEPAPMNFHPAVLPQLLPFFDAVLNAELVNAAP